MSNFQNPRVPPTGGSQRVANRLLKGRTGARGLRSPLLIAPPFADSSFSLVCNALHGASADPH